MDNKEVKIEGVFCGKISELGDALVNGGYGSANTTTAGNVKGGDYSENE